jgi:ribosomal protein S18 acetylase RimI-like enzyme
MNMSSKHVEQSVRTELIVTDPPLEERQHLGNTASGGCTEEGLAMSIVTQHVWGPREASHLFSQDTEAARIIPWQEEWHLMDVARAKDVTTLERIWAASQNADAAFHPHHAQWSLSSWATDSRLLLKDGHPIGLAAINVVPAEEVAEARLALCPPFRHLPEALALLDQILIMVQEAGRAHLRLCIPARATWAMMAAQKLRFHMVRAQHVMVRPAASGPFPLRESDCVRIRHLREGEEPVVLEALNRAWALTWNFRPIPLAALLADLKGQRKGFFVAVARTEDTHILGTVHALFDHEACNPDGQPYAWISNLTVDPALQGQGLGRMLLAFGLNYLYQQGAGSVTLGVDGGAIAPMTLYRSTGFEVLSTVEIWEQSRARLHEEK